MTWIRRVGTLVLGPLTLLVGWVRVGADRPASKK